jgi:hypothetical protein
LNLSGAALRLQLKDANVNSRPILSDIGEAARYSLDFMLRYDYAPRENLIKLFSGDDKFSSDWDMIDRTFCALRVWAVVRPNEMKTWIATIKDAEMRKALTWLLNNPWGTGPKE